MNGPDDVLIGYCHGAMANERDRQRQADLLDRLSREPEAGDPTLRSAIEAELQTFCGRMFSAAAVQTQLAAMQPALTQLGLQTKAALLRELLNGPYELTALGRSLADDVLRRGNASVQSGSDQWFGRAGAAEEFTLH